MAIPKQPSPNNEISAGQKKQLDQRLQEIEKKEARVTEVIFNPIPTEFEKFNPELHAHWKLHLGFSPEHEKDIEHRLLSLKKEYPDLDFKMGMSEQEGKDATVYVGSRDKAYAVAKRISDTFGHMLNEPKGDVLRDDAQIFGSIWGRFVMPHSKSFHQYGTHGVPLLLDDSSDIFLIRNIEKISANIERLKKEAYTRAYRLLTDYYGAYFTGSGDATYKK